MTDYCHDLRLVADRRCEYRDQCCDYLDDANNASGTEKVTAVGAAKYCGQMAEQLDCLLERYTVWAVSDPLFDPPSVIGEEYTVDIDDS